MPRLDEIALRREGFTEGARITLDDGQAWSFPKPLMRFGDAGALEFRPTVGPDGSLLLDFDQGRRVPGPAEFGPDYDAKVERLLEATDGHEEKRSLLALACDLLARNYQLGPADLCSLLVFRLGDDANSEAWAAIGEVALGRAPKPTASGSAPPA